MILFCKLLGRGHCLIVLVTRCKTFSIHLPGVSPNICTISQAIESFRAVSSLRQSWEREAAESLGRMGTVQGPQGTPSSKSINSVSLILESLVTLQETLVIINVNYVNQLRLAVSANSCCRASFQQDEVKKSDTNSSRICATIRSYNEREPKTVDRMWFSLLYQFGIILWTSRWRPSSISQYT